MQTVGELKKPGQQLFGVFSEGSFCPSGPRSCRFRSVRMGSRPLEVISSEFEGDTS